jgi:hypothetical protein
MTNETKTTNETDRRVAELERELKNARKESVLHHWMYWEAVHAAHQMSVLPHDDKHHLRCIFLLSYIKHVGWHIWPEKGFKEPARLPCIEEYLAEA